jgi:uncharacterized membrane protein YgcG
MRSRNIDARSAARIRLIIREAVRARMGLLNEADGDLLSASWSSDGSLNVTTNFVASRISISRFKGGVEGTQIKEWKNERGIAARSYELLDASAAEAQSKDADGILVRATPAEADTDPKVVTIMFAARPKAAAAPAVSAPAADAAPAGEKAEPASTDTSATADPKDPHAAAGDVQDLARRGLRAVTRDFADDDVEADNTVTIKDLSAPPAGHKWLTNEKRGSDLDDWQKDDEYTYIALVPEGEDPKPVLFVVSGDPEDNNHHSTGYILAPDSRQALHRKAFCILYKRATGETHPSCMPRSGGGRGGAGAGTQQGTGSGGAGGAGSGGSGSAGGAGMGSQYSGTSPDLDTGSRSTRVRASGDRIRSGTGDVEDVAGFNRGRERVFGRRFYSRSDEGFDRMGPGGTATPTVLRRDKKEGGDVPKTIVVVFRNPIRIDPDAIAVSKDGEQRVSLANASLGNNKDAGDIASIGFYYRKAADNLRALVSMGVPRSPGSRFGGKFTQKEDPEAFQAAADWIFANPQQFDLAEDIEFHSAKGGGKSEKGISDTEQKSGGGGEVGTGGASADAVAAFLKTQKKEEGKLNESRTPLFDRYRF